MNANGEIVRFYGFTENAREVEMDMREMTDRAKAGLPLYGVSSLTPYMQGVAARNSRYAGLFIHVIPWFNFVNHQQHGVDTAKYYQNAERELEQERLEKEQKGQVRGGVLEQVRQMEEQRKAEAQGQAA